MIRPISSTDAIDAAGLGYLRVRDASAESSVETISDRVAAGSLAAKLVDARVALLHVSVQQFASIGLGTGAGDPAPARGQTDGEDADEGAPLDQLRVRFETGLRVDGRRLDVTA